jgi:hypothetical protein
LRRSGSRAWIDALFGNAAEYQRYISELAESDILNQLQSALTARFSTIAGKTIRGNTYTPGTMLGRQVGILYALIRSRRPEKIVETGVCNGFSSAVILSALARNGIGHLHSIDLPEMAGAAGSNQEFWEGKGGAVIPEDEQSGWLVPPHLRDRWTVRLGKSSEMLPPILDELGTIDLFIHDSEHSYENQLFEFQSGFAHLSGRGVLFASDINWSNAFDVFAKEMSDEARPSYVDYSLGIMMRR